MTTCYLAPIVNDNGPFFIPGGVVPAAGGQLFFYVNRSTTNQTVYQDPAAAVAWTNPIVLDSGGNLPLNGEVWFPTGQTFTVVFAPFNDTTPPASPYWTKNDISGINDVTTTASEWQAGPAPTFISATSFSVAGDQTLIFTNGRRLQTTNSGGTIYSKITSVTFAVGITTVRVVNDSGLLDVGLSAVFYSFANPANSFIDDYYVTADGGTVSTAANGTTDIWGVKGTQVHITGTSAIFSFSSAAYAGATRLVIADTAFPINTSSIMSIPGGRNVTTAAGDRFQVSASTAAAAVIDWYQSNSAGQSQFSQSSNTVYAGPSSGANAPPAFRALVGLEAASSLLLTRVGVNTSQVNITSTDIDFTAYNEYEVHFYNFRPSVNASILGMRVAHNSSTFVSTATYAVAQIGTDQATTAINFGSPNQSAFQLMSLAANQGQLGMSTFPAMGLVRLYTPNTSPTAKLARSEVVYTNQNSSVVNVNAAHQYNGSTAAINGLTFLYNAGFVSSGTIQVVGIRPT